MWWRTSTWQNPVRLLVGAGSMIGLVLLLAGAHRLVSLPSAITSVPLAVALAVAPAFILLAGFQAAARPSPRAFAVAVVCCVLFLPLASQARSDWLPSTIAAMAAALGVLWVASLTVMAGAFRSAVVVVDVVRKRTGRPTVGEAWSAWWDDANPEERVLALYLGISLLVWTTVRVLRAVPVDDNPVSRAVSAAVLDLMSSGEAVMLGIAGMAIVALTLNHVRRQAAKPDC